MVAPTNGLAVIGGSHLATTGPVRFFGPSRVHAGFRTAF